MKRKMNKKQFLDHNLITEFFKLRKPKKKKELLNKFNKGNKWCLLMRWTNKMQIIHHLHHHPINYNHKFHLMIHFIYLLYHNLLFGTLHINVEYFNGLLDNCILTFILDLLGIFHYKHNIEFINFYYFYYNFFNLIFFHLYFHINHYIYV